jgi:methyl coenzyme M reductase subunit C-like uncharacterized protein (methanogenesis marker protein 7)
LRTAEKWPEFGSVAGIDIHIYIHTYISILGRRTRRRRKDDNIEKLTRLVIVK